MNTNPDLWQVEICINEGWILVGFGYFRRENEIGWFLSDECFEVFKCEFVH